MQLTDLENKNLGVLGLGQEGQAVAEYLAGHGYKPVLFDKRLVTELDQAVQNQIHSHNLSSYFGPDYLDHLNEVDVIFRSPGFWRLDPKLVEAEKNGLVVTSQTKWFFDNATNPIIGVTGTKGKGTTASLMAHILNEAGIKAYLTGNVGQVQPLEFLEKLQPTDWVVYELSSFQLQDLQKSPHIGVVLMVTEDHLDVHDSIAEYHHAKESIVAFQEADDIAIVNADYEASKQIGAMGAGQKLFFTRFDAPSATAVAKDDKITVTFSGESPIVFDLAENPLRGQHNWENVSAAVLATLKAGLGQIAIQAALPSFVPLPHRLQKLPDQEGIHFYNDSISTVPDTAAAAINSFTEPTILIAGGSDKGIDPAPLVEAIKKAPNVKAVVAIGTTGPVLAQRLQAIGYDKPLIQDAKNLREAMQQIKAMAAPGDVVLLSPGYASLDWYKNYKQRGQDFSDLASAWSEL